MGFSVETALDQYVLQLEEPRLPDGMWHPSSISGCARKAIYDYRGAEKSNPHDLRASRVFRVGHMYHQFVQTAIAEDPLVVVFYPEIAVESRLFRIRGHSDGLVAYAGDAESAAMLRAVVADGWNPFTDDADPWLLTWSVLELKSMNSMGFKYGNLPSQDHVDQAFAYLKILREEGGRVDDGVAIPPLGDRLRQARIVYVSKDDMLVGEYVALWSTAKDKRLLSQLDLLENNLADGTLPDRLPFVAAKKTGKPEHDYRCRFCPYRDLCWEIKDDQPLLEA